MSKNGGFVDELESQLGDGDPFNPIRRQFLFRKSSLVDAGDAAAPVIAARRPPTQLPLG